MHPAGTFTACLGKSTACAAAYRSRNSQPSHVVAAAPRDDAPVPFAFMSPKLAAGILGATAALTLALSPPAFAEPFLKSTGARGLLMREEEELYKFRQEEEGKVREELAEIKAELEEETERSRSQGQLCATPFGIDVVGITEFIALTGALVGGVSARRRKQELERLNEQLRTINTQLRQQARAGTLFAPGLTYVPSSVSSGTSSSGSSPAASLPGATKLSLPTGAVRPPLAPSMPKAGAAAASASAAAEAPTASVAPPSKADAFSAGDFQSVSLSSIDEEDQRPEVKQCQAALKEGKKLLKESNPGAAMVRFEKAFMLAKSLGDKVRERRAVRGLAATSRMTNQSRQAIKYLERVLEISKETGDHVGDADAYGTIADVYTDIGEFEKAAEFYDKYINTMNTEGPV